MSERKDPAGDDGRRRPALNRRWQLILLALAIIGFAAWALGSIETAPNPVPETSTTVRSIESIEGVPVSFDYSCRADTCEFRASEAGEAIVDWMWDFGDGEATSGGATATHTFRTAGVHRVSLTTTSTSGRRDVTAIGVNPDAPQITDSVESVVPPAYAFGPHIGSAGGWELVDPMFTSAHVSPHSDTAVSQLEAARADGKSVILLLARSAGNYKNPDGTFSLDLWKAEIDRFADIDLSPWVDDGTLLAHYLVSEPMSRSRWGGEVIPVEILDEMARYSKQLWPTMPTTVREQPTDLLIHSGGFETPVPGWQWNYLDAGWARYSARKGPVDEFVAAEVDAARAQGLGLLFGLNVLSGGDGSSGVIGYADGWVMSPEELLEYGTTLIAEPYGCANIMWHLNHDGIPYFGVPEIEKVMLELADMARSRDPVSCVAGGTH